MHFLTGLTAVAAFAGSAVAAPTPAGGFTVPTDDGFPTPSADQIKIINKIADGTLSNAPPPASLNASSFPVFQLIAHNEYHEVAFFDSLIYNITNNVKGYTFQNAKKRDEFLDILRTVLAQEKLHAINAANTLKTFNAPFVPTPCKYKFPADNVYDAIRYAALFTDLVVSTLQDAAQALARNGDVGPVRGLTSSLGQEGQQEGFYRILLSKKPSEKPFLTTSVAPFLYSFLQQRAIVSCPFQPTDIPLKIFPALNVLSGNGGIDVDQIDQHLRYSVDFTNYSDADKYVGKDSSGLWITYFTGQRKPVSVPVENIKWNGRTAKFEAKFPFEENEMMGLSIASLTSKDNFTAPGEVVQFTLAAPGLIQVEDKVKSWDGLKI